MKILHVMASVNPHGGGPMEGVRQRGLRLLEMGHRVELMTLDEPAAAYLAGFPLPVHALGSTAGGYGYNSRVVPWLLEHAKNYDALVVNGLWQYHSLAAWRAFTRLGRPYYVFTHGMLDPWFRRTYPLKHLKKWLYWPWAEYRVLRDAAAVLFTSEEERLQARQSFWLYKAQERVVAYGTAQPPRDGKRLREVFLVTHPQLRGKRIVLFLSRIHEKKGCDLLVQAFGHVAGADPALHLVVAGPDQTGQLPRLQQLAQAAGVADRVSWPGMLQGEMKWGAFYAAEVFALPSHQENFGIAVAESLGCGLPVLISDKVNIWREIEADGAGIVGPDTLTGIEQGLRHWLGLSDSERARFQECAFASFDRRFTAEAMAESLLDVLARGPQVASAAPQSSAIGAREGADQAG
jgi:glycosyltransferase involved in cell wall biosynthesis